MKKRGIGVGSMFYGLGYGFSRQDISSATIEICEDGSVIIRSGEVDFGQGSDTILCQITSEELGIRYDTIQMLTADTLTTPNAGPTSASRVTYVTGMAMLKAARAMKKTLTSVAEKILGQTDLLFGDEKVYSLSHPEKVISFKALAKAAHLRGAPMVETAWHDITTQDVNPETAQGDAYSAYAYATQIAEVEVDTETGQVEVLRIVTATDAGKAINPLNVEGQIEGGVSMGVGYALSEEIIQEGGYLKTPSLGDYMVPTSLDMPPIETHIVEIPVSHGPLRGQRSGRTRLHSYGARDSQCDLRRFESSSYPNSRDPGKSSSPDPGERAGREKPPPVRIKGRALMRHFEFYSPKSIGEALRFLSEKGDRTKIVAGGTDLIPRLREEISRPEFVLNILEIERIEWSKGTGPCLADWLYNHSHPIDGVRPPATDLSLPRRKPRPRSGDLLFGTGGRSEETSPMPLRLLTSLVRFWPWMQKRCSRAKSESGWCPSGISSSVRGRR